MTSPAKVDPITLSVVRGLLKTTQREMTLSLDETARSSVFNLAHDYSTALFNGRPEMIEHAHLRRLGAGSIIAGPAIIEEVTTTIVIEPGWTSALHQSGSYVLTRQQGS